MSTTQEHRTALARSRDIFVESIRIIVPLLILAAGIGFLAISGSLRKTPKQPAAVEGPPKVRTATVLPFEGRFTAEVDGFVVPFREVILTAEVNGSIHNKSPECRAGRFVKAGTILLEIDPQDYELELKRLQQEKRRSEIAVHEIDVQLENLKELAMLAETEQGLQTEEVKRLRSLVGQRIVAQSDLDRARSGEIISRNAVQQLVNEARVLIARRQSTNAAIELAKIQIEQAELNFRRTKIEAPVDGVIVRELVEEGAYVQRGTPLLELEDTSAVEVQCNITRDDLAVLARSQPRPSLYALPQLPVQVIYTRDNDEEFVWDGVLSRFDGVGMDAQTRMFPVRILVDDPLGGRPWSTDSVADPQSTGSAPALMRGMYTRVRVEIPSSQPLVEIPRAALQLGDVVWRVRDRRLSVVDVNVAERRAGTFVVELNGQNQLTESDRVITSPLTTVVEGMEVQEIEALTGTSQEGATLADEGRDVNALIFENAEDVSAEDGAST